MAEASGTPEDELTLPRAAVNKMIKEMIPNIRVSNDARELVLNCCTEFIHLVSSEANDICNKQTKKTISPEHIIAALESLGFTDYVQDVKEVYEQFKTQTQTRKKISKSKNLGVSEEELLQQQQALIAQARYQQAQEEWLQMQMQQQQLQQQQQMAQCPPSENNIVSAACSDEKLNALNTNLLPQSSSSASLSSNSSSGVHSSVLEPNDSSDSLNVVSKIENSK